MAGWRCFLIKPVAYVRRELRVFSFSKTAICPAGPMSGHDASVIINAQLEKPLAGPDGYEVSVARVEDFLEDKRWPTICDQCGATMSLAHCERQVNDMRLWEGFPDRRLRSLSDADVPIGTMWDAWWMGSLWKGPDGMSLMLKCPRGDWAIDGPASNGPGWSRTGTAPNLTARPSIGIGGRDNSQGFAFHGWLTDGVLTADIDGKSFPEHPFTA